MLAVHETLLERDGTSPFDEKWFDRPDQDHRITTRIDVGGYQWARSEALRAHATQVDPTRPAGGSGSTTPRWPTSTRGRT